MILVELKARVAKYEDATQLAKYKDELARRNTTSVLMWLVAPHIPSSIREFLDGIGIEYTDATGGSKGLRSRAEKTPLIILSLRRRPSRSRRGLS
jgi:RecB family endonuclease NucS